MKISIVVPTYKRARVLSAALDQLLSQTLADFELLVMDDGFPDETAQVGARIQDPRPATLQALRSARWVTHRWRGMKLNVASSEGP